MAAHHTLYEYWLRARDQHRPPRPRFSARGEIRMTRDDRVGVDSDEVVREAVLQLFEPPRGNQREHFAFVRDGLAQDDVER